jgi:hypothetical protein
MASLYKGVDAQKVAEEIMSIGETATPTQIVEKARDEKSELHKCFEWNDAKAAMAYRLQQARTVVHVLVIEEEEPPKENSAYIRRFECPEQGKGYKPIEVIFKCEDEYQQLLRQAYADLQAFKTKYARLTELREIIELIA